MDSNQNAAAQTPLQRLLALPAMKQAVFHQAGNYYTAPCPAHEDANTSLLIREDAGAGTVKVLCFAGCAEADIYSAVGLTESDPRQPGPVSL